MYVSLDLLHRVSLPAWAALSRAYGVRKAPRTLPEVRAALHDAPPQLASAIRTLRALGSEESRPFVLEAARVLGVAALDVAPDAGNAELVAALLTRAAKDTTYAEVLEAAKYRLCRREPEAAARRYVGARAPAGEPRVTAATLKKVASILERAGAMRQAPGRWEVTLLSDAPTGGEASVTLEIVRPDPPMSYLARDTGGALVVTRIAPVQVDRVVVARRGDGRPVLWVWTAAPELLSSYCAAVGDALFGDAALFATASPISLRAIHQRQEEALDVKHARTARLKNARVVWLVLDPGMHETLAIAGRNVLRALVRDDQPIRGQLAATRIRLDFDDGPVDVTLRAPNVVHWEPCVHDAAIRAFLESLDLDAPGADDLITLAPHDHPAWRWRAAVGDDVFARLQDQGCFKESTSRALAHPEHAAAGRISLAFELAARGKGRHYAVPEEGFDVGARLVTDVDLVTYQLDVEALAAVLRHELGATRGEPDAVGDAGEAIERGALVEIGDVAVGPATARLFLAVAGTRGRGVAARLRGRSAGAHPVIIVPRGHRLESGCVEVELASLAGPFAPLRGAIARSLGIADARTLTSRAPAGTRIAVEERTGRTEIDGVEMVSMAESTLRLLRALVEAGGAPVASARCDERVSPRRQAGGAAKAAKKKFVAGARASFALAGREAPGDLEEMIVGTGVGYRVTVRGWMG